MISTSCKQQQQQQQQQWQQQQQNEIMSFCNEKLIGIKT